MEFSNLFDKGLNVTNFLQLSGISIIVLFIIYFFIIKEKGEKLNKNAIIYIVGVFVFLLIIATTIISILKIQTDVHIDKNNEIIISLKYQITELKNKRNKNNKELIKLREENTQLKVMLAQSNDIVNNGEISEGLMAIQDKNGQWGYANQSGVITIGYKFQVAKIFLNNRAIVKFNGSWGAIDKNGKKVIPFAYYSMLPCNDSGCFVKVRNTKTAKPKYLDRNGDWVKSE